MQAAQPNRLIHETSPYLLQHAYNPVRWYSWGAEAFDRAKAEDKPVFLSIGYSTCHWCHVMAHESFEDEEVARILDEGFIAVKVDKEERPDIDSVYMSVCQALTGQGGWPLTLLLTPEQKPFYAATYLPKRARGGMPGLMELLSGVMRGWEDNRPALLDAGEEIVRALRRDNEDFGGEGLSRGTLHKALLYFQNAFDPIYGGFGSAPKFPTPHNLLFLLRMHASEGEEKALNMVNTTLRSMVRGGIFDHIGGGFSRYSTDRKWLVPHFEKMLYDNALLAMAYLEAFQITEDPLYEWTARRIFAYTQRELRHPEGGFFCAQDADSEGVEGKYYVFSPDELEPVLGGETALFCRYFDITQTGNFEGQSIPNRLHAAAEVPGADIARLCEKAEAYRRERTSLHKDDKILVSWNALMIAALSKAYRILGDERCLEQAGEAAGFIEKYLMEGECLYVSFRDGKSAGQGHLDDYAFLAWGYLELFDASGDPDALEKAIRLTEVLHKEFHDPKDGGFYLYSHSGEQLIARPKEIYDGAIPSGNSAAAYVLTRIAQLTGEPKWLERARRQMDFLGRNIESFPGAYTFGLMAAMQTLYFSREIVVFAKDASDAARARRLVNSRFHPNTALLLLGGGGDEKLKQLCPFLKDYTRRDNETTVYLCRNNACAQPFTGLEKLEKELQMESGPLQ